MVLTPNVSLNRNFIKSFIILNIINFADMANRNFIKSFIILNIINFADMIRKEKNRIS